mgnify:CR=1 FL=1
MKEKVKYILLFTLLFLVLTPFLKQHTNILQNKFVADDLRGYFPPVDSANFSLQNWMDGKYQSQQEEFLKRNLKIRPHAVRVNNQLHYDILDEIRSTIVEGKDGYLFETMYIRSLQGLDFIGTKKIEEQVEKLKVALELISPEEKMILLLKYQDYLSIKEIESALGIGESAVKMRIKRAKDKLITVYNKNQN